MKYRIIAAALVVAMLLGLTSCKNKKKDDVDEPTGDGLTVEVEPVEYSEEYIGEASLEVAALTRELARVFGYSEQVKDSDITEVVDTFKNDIVPILTDVAIYPSELTGLFGCVRECIALADKEEDSTKVFSDMYTKFTLILDGDRLGALVYELQLLTFEKKAEDAQKKYDKLGYVFYLEDVNYYNSLTQKAKSLGRADFASALSVLAFTASAFNGSAEFNGDDINITVSDSVAIMKKQAEKFAELKLDESDWKTVADMCGAFIPKNVSDDLKGKMLIVLENGNFFVESAAVMPELIKFYATITANVSKENISLVENKAEYAYVRAICSEIVKNENAFRALLSSVEEKISEASEECIELVNIYKKSGYKKFLSEYNAGASELVFAVKTFDADPTEANYKHLTNVIMGYLANVNSVVAYVYLYM